MGAFVERVLLLPLPLHTYVVGLSFLSRCQQIWPVIDHRTPRYLTRGMGKMCGAQIDESFPWPTCSMHYDMVTSYTDFYSWVWYSLYDPHGPVHIWIGGVLDCEDTYEEIASLVGPEIAEELALYSFIHRKNLFRQGLFYCEGTASVDQTPSEVRLVVVVKYTTYCLLDVSLLCFFLLAVAHVYDGAFDCLRTRPGFLPSGALLWRWKALLPLSVDSRTHPSSRGRW